MGVKNNNALFFTCSLIEYIGRDIKRTRCEVIDYLGKDRVKRIYEYSDVFHCEPIEKTAEEFIKEAGMPEGDFDNVKKCRYTVPGYWDIGEVYERLIEISMKTKMCWKGYGRFTIPGLMRRFQIIIQISIISREII